MSEAFLLQVGTYLIGDVSGTWQLEQRPVSGGLGFAFLYQPRSQFVR